MILGRRGQEVTRANVRSGGEVAGQDQDLQEAGRYFEIFD
jgi:hypothetical protein